MNHITQLCNHGIIIPRRRASQFGIMKQIRIGRAVPDPRNVGNFSQFAMENMGGESWIIFTC